MNEPVYNETQVREELAKEHDVDANLLEFIGTSDARQFCGMYVLNFNIIDPKHKAYLSTVAYIIEEGGE